MPSKLRATALLALFAVAAVASAAPIASSRKLLDSSASAAASASSNGGDSSASAAASASSSGGGDSSAAAAASASSNGGGGGSSPSPPPPAPTPSRGCDFFKLHLHNDMGWCNMMYTVTYADGTLNKYFVFAGTFGTHDWDVQTECPANIVSVTAEPSGDQPPNCQLASGTTCAPWNGPSSLLPRNEAWFHVRPVYSDGGVTGCQVTL